ncbi:toll/interleukin-1 receptor domain-containing protein [Paenibacillus elgii]
MIHKSAFVSYSWDGHEHETWVMRLVNRLREKGIDATFDKFEMYTSTINLNTMMIKAIRDYDQVIIVLTENYAKKADNLDGGVGFETILTLPDLLKTDKIILIMRHTGDYSKVFPFHLRGYYAIDFSDDSLYEQKLEELVHRVYSVGLFEKAPLGQVPDLRPKAEVPPPKVSKFSDLEVTKLRKVTDMDKATFMGNSFESLDGLFLDLFNHIKSQDADFEFTHERVTTKKVLYKLFVDGQYKTGIKMWLGGWGFGSFDDKINFSYGRHIDANHDNSMNEMLICEVIKNEPKLKMSMNMMGENPQSLEEIVRVIWKRNIATYLEN